MTSIEKSVRIFNESLLLAAAKLEGVSNEERRRIMGRLGEIVRASIRAGLEDPTAIVTAAIEAAKTGNERT